MARQKPGEGLSIDRFEPLHANSRSSRLKADQPTNSTMMSGPRKEGTKDNQRWLMAPLEENEGQAAKEVQPSSCSQMARAHSSYSIPARAMARVVQSSD